MKKWIVVMVLVVLGSVYLAQAAFAGMDKVDIAFVPTSDLSGGMVALSMSFGAGGKRTAKHIERAAEDAGGAGEAKTGFWSAVGTHFADNWGKWLTGVAVAAGTSMVLENNDLWPFNKSADDSTVAASSASSPSGTAAAGSGGTVTYINITGDNNIVAADDVVVTTSAAE